MHMYGNRFAMILALMFFLLLPLHTATAQEPPESQALDTLPFDVSLGDPLVVWFNQAARPSDIARANDISDIELLDRIEVGRKLMIFKSVRTAEEHLPRMADRIDMIGYNLEGRAATPQEEQADPITSISRMRELADRYDLALAVGPDHDFALEYGVEMAPYVDIFVLQIQRVQTDPETVHEFVVPLVDQLREANPSIQTMVQVRTEGDAPAVVDLLASLQESIDGVSILTSPTTLNVYEDLVAALRPSAPHVDLSAVAAAETEAPGRQQAKGFLPTDPFALGILAGVIGAISLIVLPAVAVVWVVMALTILMLAYRLLAPRRERTSSEK